MASPQLALSAGNALIDPVARQVVNAGGNAVDACLAAAIASWVAEPFMCSLGGSGFVAVRDPAGEVVVYDGNNTMPLSIPAEPGQGLRRIFVEDYANGLHTGIGGGSVAVPGILAAIRMAWESHGNLEWAGLFEHAIALAREGIAFPHTSAYYLSATYREVWSVYEAAADLLVPDGEPLPEGSRFIQNDLAETLGLIAADGPEVFYGGEVGTDVIKAIQDDGGFMTAEDLTTYEAKVRVPISADVFGWRVDSNPPPSIGGAVLTQMLTLLEEADLSDPLLRLQAIISAERTAVGNRGEHFEDPGQVAVALEDAEQRAHKARRSSSTTHTSAASADGYVCSLTQSNGYGSGMIVDGVLLNNTLGEEELNPGGVHGLPPGARCYSNMAPTIATGPASTVGLGSPGAERIVGAIAQTFIGLAMDGKTLPDAIKAPRLHLQRKRDGDLLCYEPGIPGDRLGYPTRPYDAPHMFFGAVQAASVDDAGNVAAVFDARRSGGAVTV